MVAFDDSPDDTFEVSGGIAEVVTLVVTRSHRSTGYAAGEHVLYRRLTDR